MNLAEYHAEDLRGLVAAIDEHGIFDPGEREAWDEEIDDAEGDCGSLMSLNQALLNAMDDRDGIETVIDEHTNPETDAFV